MRSPSICARAFVRFNPRSALELSGQRQGWVCISTHLESERKYSQWRWMMIAESYWLIAPPIRGHVRTGVWPEKERLAHEQPLFAFPRGPERRQVRALDSALLLPAPRRVLVPIRKSKGLEQRRQTGTDLGVVARRPVRDTRSVLCKTKSSSGICPE